MQRTGFLCFLLILAALGCRTEDPASDVEARQERPPSEPEQVSFYLPQEVPAVADTVDLRDLSRRLDVIERRLEGVAAALDRMAPVAAEENAEVGAAPEDATAALEEQIEETSADAQQFGLRALWAVVILILFFFLVKASAWVLETLSERSAARRLFFKRLIPVIRIVLWVVAIYYILAGIFEVDRAGLVASLAALGIAVGFAAQDVLKNIFGGIIIILDQPFQVGDKISIGGTYGEVVSIGLRSTRIVTPDDNLVSVPNAQVVEGQVANANAGALHCQVVVDLYLPGWVDVMKAKSIAYSAAASSKYVYLEKPIVVLVKDEFRETFLTNLKVKAYVLDTRYESAFASDVTETAKTEFLQHNMLLPVFGMSNFEEAWSRLQQGAGDNGPANQTA